MRTLFRKIGLVTALNASLLGCGREEQLVLESQLIEHKPLRITQSETPYKTSETTYQVPITKTLEETIKIASFNIQTFGKTKREKQDVMNVLTAIVRNFDITAVQELRDKSETTLPYFVEMINILPGPMYDFIGSERLGRSSYKERYGFVYNTETVRFIGLSYVYNDIYDIFEREPFIAGFRSGKFDFILVNVHTKPEDARKEIPALVDVIRDANRHFPNDHDVIVLGDLNADGRYFYETMIDGLRNSSYRWPITNDMDTTVAESSNTYDRIVFQRRYTDEDFANKAGVFRFDQKYNLENYFAKQVSDHYPVWAKFYTNRDWD